MNRHTKVIAITFAATFGLVGSVAAYCPQPMSFGSQSLAAQVNDQLDWQLCLHNEQVGSLNRHADLLNSLSDRLAGLAGLIRMEGDRVDAVVVRERVDFTERQVMQQRIVDLEQRIETLERLIAER